MTLFEIVPSLRHAVTPRIDRAIWPLTTRVDELGRLCVGEVALTEVADEFGTPTYVIDEADFRHRIRRFRAALQDARLVYAGRALLTTVVARWAAEEEVLACAPVGNLRLRSSRAWNRTKSSCMAWPRAPLRYARSPTPGSAESSSRVL